jgi:ABC-type nitrate/sulfonate/bicarbonate transport system permease component
MAEQIEAAPDNNFSFTRVLSLPLLALVLALLLIYAGPPAEAPNIARWISFPEFLGGDYLRAGLRNLAIVFGLSCFPGAIIGAGIGRLISRNSKLASGSLHVLRIGQWAPFLLWWVLTSVLSIVPTERPGRNFVVWTMSIPAVALGSCYHILCMRYLAGQDWQRSICETVGLAIHRSLLISIVLSLTVWMDNWVVFPGNDNVLRHYVAVAVLALFLFVVNWIYRSGIEQSATLHREIILADLSRRNDGSTWTAAFIVLFFVAIWHLFSLIGNFSVSPVRVFNAAVTLFSDAAIWRDMRISLLEIFAGLVFSVVIALIVSAPLLTHVRLRTWLLPILSLTFVIPILVLPAGQGWLMYRGLFRWTATCVACLFLTTTGVAVLSFFPVMQTVWALREKPILCRILFATEQALPYGFTAMLYGEMMSATAGLGFTVVGATATNQIEKAFAGFVITLSLLFGLSSTLRLLARWRYFSGVSSKENHI